MPKQTFITATQAAELRDQHKYPPFDANSIELYRLSQWIEEEAVHTDTIVLKGVMHFDKVNQLTRSGYKVQILYYSLTLIQWPTI